MFEQVNKENGIYIDFFSYTYIEFNQQMKSEIHEYPCEQNNHIEYLMEGFKSFPTERPRVVSGDCWVIPKP